MRYIDLMGGQKPHLLVKTVNNLGAETHVHYAPSTKFYLADKLAGTALDHAAAVPGARGRARRDLRPHQPQPLRHPLRLPPRLLRRRRARVPRLRHGRAVGHRGVRRAQRRAARFPMATNIDAASHVPPVLTKTWFHTGVYLDGRPHLATSSSTSTTVRATATGERVLTDEQLRAMTDCEDTGCLLSTTPCCPTGLTAGRRARGLPRAERRRCCARRSTRWTARTKNASIPTPSPSSNYTIERLQPRAGNRHAVFFTHPRETISYPLRAQAVRRRRPRNGRSPRQPRADAGGGRFGNVLKSVAIGYGRRQPDPSRAHRADQEQADADRSSPTPRTASPTPVDAARRLPRAAAVRDTHLRADRPDATGPTATNRFRFDDMRAEIQRRWRSDSTRSPTKMQPQAAIGNARIAPDRARAHAATAATI